MGNCCCGSDNVNLFPSSDKVEREFQREFRFKVNRGESEFANYVLLKIQEYKETGKPIKICLELHKPSFQERKVILQLLFEQLWGVRLKSEKFRDGIRYNERINLEEQEFKNYLKNIAIREVKNLDINDINFDHESEAEESGEAEEGEQTESETGEGEEAETGEGETQEDSDNAEVKVNDEQDNPDTESGEGDTGDNGDDDADLEAAIRLSRCAAQSPIASPMLSPLASPRVSKSPRASRSSHPSRSPRPSQVNLTVNVTASPRGPLSPRISNEKIDITEEIIKHKYIKMRYWLLYRIKQ